MYWGFLVVTGLISVMVLIEAPVPQKVGYAAFLESTTDGMVSCTKISSSSPNSTFPPPALNLFSRNDAYFWPVIDADWAHEHHCSSPCISMATTRGPAIFRQADDYQLATKRSLIKLYDVPEFISSKDRLAASFQLFIRQWSIFVLPYVVSQGVWAAAFGRRSPTQTRDALYIFLRHGGKPVAHQSTAQISIHPRRKLIAK